MHWANAAWMAAWLRQWGIASSGRSVIQRSIYGSRAHQRSAGLRVLRHQQPNLHHFCLTAVMFCCFILFMYSMHAIHALIVQSRTLKRRAIKCLPTLRLALCTLYALVFQPLSFALCSTAHKVCCFVQDFSMSHLVCWHAQTKPYGPVYAYGAVQELGFLVAGWYVCLYWSIALSARAAGCGGSRPRLYPEAVSMCRCSAGVSDLRAMLPYQYLQLQALCLRVFAYSDTWALCIGWWWSMCSAYSWRICYISAESSIQHMVLVACCYHALLDILLSVSGVCDDQLRVAKQASILQCLSLCTMMYDVDCGKHVVLCLQLLPGIQWHMDIHGLGFVVMLYCTSLTAFCHWLHPNKAATMFSCCLSWFGFSSIPCRCLCRWFHHLLCTVCARM